MAPETAQAGHDSFWAEAGHRNLAAQFLEDSLGLAM
jgi:hypothetical protein